VLDRPRLALPESTAFPMAEFKSLKGSLLVAAPGLLDPNFARSVVFLADHSPKGAFGLVLNRPADMKIADIWAALSSDPCSCSATAFVGGPVQKGAVLLLHGHPELAPLAEPVIPGVFLGSEVELLGELLKLESLARGDPSRPAARFRVFCGYAGWAAGQLDGEMKAGGWLTCAASAEHVFSTPPEQLWGQAMRSLGGIYGFFALMPRHPEMN